jgi:hypothetical protein
VLCSPLLSELSVTGGCILRLQPSPLLFLVSEECRIFILFALHVRTSWTGGSNESVRKLWNAKNMELKYSSHNQSQSYATQTFSLPASLGAKHPSKTQHQIFITVTCDHLCGLVLRVPGYRSRGLDSISGTIRFSEKKWVWNGIRLVS